MEDGVSELSDGCELYNMSGIRLLVYTLVYKGNLAIYAFIIYEYNS